MDAAVSALSGSNMLQISPHSRPLLEALTKSCCELSARDAPPSEWQVTVSHALSRLELELLRVSSLHSKLPDLSTLLPRLLIDLEEESLVNDQERLHIEKHLMHHRHWDRQAAMHQPEPDQVELLLKAEASRPPVAGATACAHRMFVARNGDHWRLAIALSSDHDAG